MTPNSTLMRLIREIVAPQTVALSRTITYFNTTVQSAVQISQQNITTVQGFVITAQNHATDAATSAATASTAATNASQSATDAAASSAASAAVLRSFNSRWLGDHDSDPTSDASGNPLTDGAEYYNTATGRIRVYSNANRAWTDISDADLASVSAAQASAAAAAGSATSAQTYSTAAAGSATNAATSASNAAATYAEMQKIALPMSTASVANYVPQVSSDGTAYTLLSPGQFLKNIGAAPITSPNFLGVPLAPDVADWSATTPQIPNVPSIVNYLMRNYVSATSLSTTLNGYATQDAFTSYQTTLSTNLTNTLKGYVGTPSSTDTVNYPISVFGINRTTGLPWIMNGATNAYYSLYPASVIDTKLQSYLQLIGGKISGPLSLYISAVANNYSSDTVGTIGVSLFNSAWTKPVLFGIGAGTDSAGLSNSYGSMTLQLSDGTILKYKFTPTSVVLPNGVALADVMSMSKTYQPIGDYATNTTVTNKATALQTAIDTLTAKTVVTVPDTSNTQNKITNLYQDAGAAAQNGTYGITIAYSLGSDATQTVPMVDLAYATKTYQPVGDYTTNSLAQATYLQKAGGTVGPLTVTGNTTLSNMVQDTATSYYGAQLISAITGRGTTGTYGAVQMSLMPMEYINTDLFIRMSIQGYGGKYDFDFHKSGDITTGRGTVVQSPSGVNTLETNIVDVSTLVNNTGTFMFDVAFGSVPAISQAFIGSDGSASVTSVTDKGYTVVSTASTGKLHITASGTV